MTRRSALRASDLDRELVAERLRDAASEGRLTTGELEDRLEVALVARTYGQLRSALTDLPDGREERLPVPLWARAGLAAAGAVGVLAAAAAAAVLFTLVACLSAVWIILTRTVSRRGRLSAPPPGRLRPPARGGSPAPSPRRLRPPARGRRALLP